MVTETPLLIGDGLGELAFERGARGERFDEFLGEGFIEIEVFTGKDDDASGKAVAHGVQGSAALAGFGPGTGAELGVALIGGGSFRGVGWHGVSFPKAGAFLNPV